MSLREESELETLRTAIGGLLRCRVVKLERIGGGRNSRVYRAVDAASQSFAVKVYFRHTSDKRDRLATEYGSLAFLWERGTRNVPRPIAADPEGGYAVYQFIEGEKIAAESVRVADLDAAVEFLARLRQISRQPESREIGPASEAFFSAQEVVENIRQRFERLREGDGEATARRALGAFLTNEFGPALDRLARWSAARLEDAGTSPAQMLSWDDRTLSPSDFGFHNALRQADGRLIFLDFEYFGWDDPAKMIADFLLHPAMGLSVDLGSRFAAGILRHFSSGLARRLEALYPLFGLKWCLILLNEFLPDPLLRRRFAGAAGPDRSVLQRKQLDQARQMLSRINEEYEHFPFCA